jgi:pSer/pThr/pTyr-binding forkhead associated (FHA) protein
MVFPEEKTFQRNVDLISRIRFEFEDGKLEYEIPSHHKLLLGRNDDNKSVDVDLIPFGAYRFGVSRQHIYLEQRYGRWFVVDMESHNHTWLNGQKLHPNVAYILSNGDELRLSNLRIHVYFEWVSRPKILHHKDTKDAKKKT